MLGHRTTCASAATHPAVRELDIVELSPQVIEVAPWFADVSGGVLEGAGRDDLDVRVHVDDGRSFVMRSRESWGVISLEPLMPYTPAAIHFYTEDFYREARARLEPGGTMCQWIPIHGMSREHLRSLVSSFVRVFPGAAMFHVEGAVALVGSDRPIELDVDHVAERLSAPPVRADLADAGFDDPVRALATVVAVGDILEDFGDAPPMTDEHPILEFHPIPAGVQPKHLWENLTAMLELRERTGHDVLLSDDPDVAARGVVAMQVGDLVVEGQQQIEQAGLLKRVGKAADTTRSLATARRRSPTRPHSTRRTPPRGGSTRRSNASGSR